MKISEVLAQQTATLENVEITEIGSVREFNKFGNAGRVCNAKIKDDSGQMELTLWNEDVDIYVVGDVITITEGWVKEWNGNLQITSGRNGKIEKAGAVEAPAAEETKEEEKAEEAAPEETKTEEAAPEETEEEAVPAE